MFRIQRAAANHQNQRRVRLQESIFHLINTQLPFSRGAQGAVYNLMQYRPWPVCQNFVFYSVPAWVFLIYNVNRRPPGAFLYNMGGPWAGGSRYSGWSPPPACCPIIVLHIRDYLSLHAIMGPAYNLIYDLMILCNTLGGW